MLLLLKEKNSKVQSKEYRLVRYEAVQSSWTCVQQGSSKTLLNLVSKIFRPAVGPTQRPMHGALGGNEIDHVPLCRVEFKT